MNVRKKLSEKTLTRVFLVLTHARDAMRPSEVAKKVGLRLSTAAAALRQLESRGVAEHVGRGLWRLYEEYR